MYSNEYMHYLPQFYLKNFSMGKDKKVWNFNTLDKKLNFSGVGRIAGENNYYTALLANGQVDNSFDEHLKTVERNAARAIKFVSDELKGTSRQSVDFMIPPGHRAALAEFLYWQMRRTPIMVEQVKKAWRKDVDRWAEEFSHLPGSQPYKDNPEQESKNLALQTLFKADEQRTLCEIMKLKVWRFVVVPDGCTRLITTDNAIFKDNDKRQFFSVIDEETAFQFPLTHNIFLIILGNVDGQGRNIIRIVDSEKDIQATNNRLANMAIRWIIAPDQNTMEKLARYQAFQK
jgi:hypothetical protein